MAIAVLKLIEEAEQTAQEICSSAARESRDMIKAVEEAVVAEGRQTVRTLHEETQRQLDEAKVLIGDEIKSLEVRRGAEQAAMRDRAKARVKMAGQSIFERVVSDGHR